MTKRFRDTSTISTDVTWPNKCIATLGIARTCRAQVLVFTSSNVIEKSKIGKELGRLEYSDIYHCVHRASDPIVAGLETSK